MQKLLLLLSFLLISYFAFGQTNQDKILELVKEGVVYHDGKQYQKAIEKSFRIYPKLGHGLVPH